MIEKERGESLESYNFESHPVLTSCPVCGSKECVGEIYVCPICKEENICSSRIVRIPAAGDGPDKVMHQKTVKGNSMHFCGPVRRVN